MRERTGSTPGGMPASGVIVFVNVRALMYAWSGRYELDRRIDAATK